MQKMRIKNNAYPQTYLLWLFALLLFSIDQLSKYGIVYYHQHLPYALNAYMNISYVVNHGMMWGLSPDYGIYATASGLLCIAWMLACSNLKQHHPWCLTLITVGGLSNMSDRLCYGGVIDWIDAHIHQLHWPSFNCADMYIVVGVGCILGQSCLQTPQPSRMPNA